ncbi:MULTISPECIES: hypothetical protein [Yimella]|uniref:FHA domain-containing protein n=1 Tax=Yimella lutea TaxID=587872 RepID=A0A542EEB1_9MICO|nr:MULTISPECIES: hypothetical protein [Yimella]MCG8656102.1 hypothetical protein [Yimella sp. NH-Cas1]TQJ13671.1 hypothetical protein FB459_1097 [Yimella lutea]
MSGARLTIDFAGEIFEVSPERTFTVGRTGDLELDDNGYLHRHFLEFAHRDGLWWMHNVGSRLPATITGGSGLMRSTVAPGAGVPIVFSPSVVTFSAGATTYELELTTNTDIFESTPHVVDPGRGKTTIAPTTFTVSQLQAIVALAEPMLKYSGSGAWQIPTSADAAKRLGWTQTKFNRKLDNVCDKLARAGVRGLRGSESDLAVNRRMVLVEYAVATLLITADDLHLLALGEDTPDRIVR